MAAELLEQAILEQNPAYQSLDVNGFSEFSITQSLDNPAMISAMRKKV